MWREPEPAVAVGWEMDSDVATAETEAVSAAMAEAAAVGVSVGATVAGGWVEAPEAPARDGKRDGDSSARREAAPAASIIGSSVSSSSMG